MKPGDKVCCINDGPCFICGTVPSALIKGNVYVVTRCSQRETEPVPTVDLIGITPPRCHSPITAYAASRFRKLDELKAEARQRQADAAKSLTRSMILSKERLEVNESEVMKP